MLHGANKSEMFTKICGRSKDCQDNDWRPRPSHLPSRFWPREPARKHAEHISVLGTGLAATFASVTCPNGTDNCALNTISGPVSKTIGSITSAGTLSVTLYSDQSAASVLRGPNTNDCYATEGSGSISNGTGTNILKFRIYGLICESSIVGCGAGPLSFSVRTGRRHLCDRDWNRDVQRIPVQIMFPFSRRAGCNAGPHR